MRPASSLRARLLGGVLLSVSLVWIAVAAVGWLRARHEAEELFDAHLAQAAAVLVSLLAQGEDGDGDEDEREFDLEHAPELHPYARNVVFQVWERGRKLRIHSRNAPREKLSGIDKGFADVQIGGQRWRVFSTWAFDRGLLVQVGERVEAREALSEEIAWHLVAPLLVALPVLAAALSFAIGRALGSLRAIARAIDARDPKRLEPVSVAHVPAEVRSIVERLNALFDRIAALLERERAFTADAAHELRTPLAAIRAQAQVARESAEEDERSHALDQVMVGCDRAARLSDQLLVMARLDAAEWSQQFAVCDLGEIAREVLGELAQIAHSRGVALELECAGRVEVFGVASLLHILLRNLVDNAIRYGAHRSQVRIETDSRSRDPVLQVCDDGPGIPVEQRDRVLDRFHRGLGHDEPGAGLGLSIVVRIATLHGATLTLGEGPDGRGLEASIRFPPPRLTTER